jgi:hypothetical protein
MPATLIFVGLACVGTVYRSKAINFFFTPFFDPLLGWHTACGVLAAFFKRLGHMKFVNIASLSAAALTALMGLSTAALAGPIYTFNTSSGTQPSNVGTITLTQVNSTSVDVSLVFSAANYGLVNTGGPHVTFGFNLAAGPGTLGISFVTPPGGNFAFGSFSLNTAGAGGFNTILDDSAGNGSSKGYYGPLEFVLSRSGGLSTDDFIDTDSGAYFEADLTDGAAGNTGEQIWKGGSTTYVPEPLTMSLFGAGLAGIGALRRRKRAQQA